MAAYYPPDGYPAQTPAPTAVPDINNFNFVGDVLWLLFVLVIVVLLAYFSLRLIGRAKNTRGTGNIKVLEAASIGFQNTVQLIKAGEQYYLIGVYRSGIVLLGEVKPESINFHPKPPADAPFEKVLSRFFKKGDAGGGNNNNDGVGRL